EGSAQITELQAGVEAFKLFAMELLNVVVDSKYVYGALLPLEFAFIKRLNNKELFNLFVESAQLCNARTEKCFVMHVRSHSNLPGTITEGNAIADRLTATAHLPNALQQAKIMHEFFHNNAKSLMKLFDITLHQATDIVRMNHRIIESKVAPLPQTITAVPRGLCPNEIWHSDLTHVPEFGRLKYIHLSINTFSSFVVATAHTGEKAQDVPSHFLCPTAILGIPKTIKTDNGLGYVSTSLKQFFKEWGIQHVTGIPHSPMGQSTVKSMQRTLKGMIKKQ
ncbi:POK6 protein, partial [Indicator maculatus]|nr:POK6 protein [Indicator maculatus]